MREYKQLTEEDRIEIYAMKQAGKEPNQDCRQTWLTRKSTAVSPLLISHQKYRPWIVRLEDNP